MKRVDQVITLLIVLACLRLGINAVREFQDGVAPWPAAFWLCANCMLYFMYVGLTWARMQYAAVAPGLRGLSAVAGLLIAAFQLIANVVGGEVPPAVVVAVLFVASAAMAARPVNRAAVA